MHQQFWGHNVEGKIYLGVREQKRLNITGLDKLLEFKLSRCCEWQSCFIQCCHGAVSGNPASYSVVTVL